MENSIKKHETSTTFDVDGRTFVINSYDPMTGNYILMQVLTKVLPLGIGNILSKNVEKGTEKIPSVGASFPVMSKNEFIQLQTDILSTVEEYYKESGMKSPVVRENGTYGVADVTMVLTLKLLVASLTFNFKDFFDELPSLTDLM